MPPLCTVMNPLKHLLWCPRQSEIAFGKNRFLTLLRCHDRAFLGYVFVALGGGGLTVPLLALKHHFNPLLKSHHSHTEGSKMGQK